MNEFIELLRISNGYCEKNVRFNTIVLDNSIHSIIDNGIICNQLNWKAPIYDKEKRDYVEWDYKYDVISSVFHTEEPKNIIWLKFTQKGHVGVVAKSFDSAFFTLLSKFENLVGNLIVGFLVVSLFEKLLLKLHMSFI